LAPILSIVLRGLKSMPTLSRLRKQDSLNRKFAPRGIRRFPDCQRVFLSEGSGDMRQRCPRRLSYWPAAYPPIRRCMGGCFECASKVPTISYPCRSWPGIGMSRQVPPFGMGVPELSQLRGQVGRRECSKGMAWHVFRRKGLTSGRCGGRSVSGSREAGLPVVAEGI
jgi:hypothetical protein